MENHCASPFAVARVVLSIGILILPSIAGAQSMNPEEFNPSSSEHERQAIYLRYQHGDKIRHITLYGKVVE